MFTPPLQGAAANPENEDQQQRLREAAEGLRVATNAAAQNAIKKKIVNRLEVRTGGWLSGCHLWLHRVFWKKRSNHQNNAYIKNAKSKLAVSDSLGTLKELTQFEKLL